MVYKALRTDSNYFKIEASHRNLWNHGHSWHSVKPKNGRGCILRDTDVAHKEFNQQHSSVQYTKFSGYC